MIWGDIVIENGCPALIDRETFEGVVEEVEVPEISEPVITQTTYGRRKTA